MNNSALCLHELYTVQNFLFSHLGKTVRVPTTRIPGGSTHLTTLTDNTQVTQLLAK